MKKILISFLALGLVLGTGAQQGGVKRSDKVQTETTVTKKADKDLKKKSGSKGFFKKKADKAKIERTINTSKAQPVKKTVKGKDLPPVQDVKKSVDFE